MHPAISSFKIDGSHIFGNMGYTILEVFYCPFCGVKMEIVDEEPVTAARSFIGTGGLYE